MTNKHHFNARLLDLKFDIEINSLADDNPEHLRSFIQLSAIIVNLPIISFKSHIGRQIRVENINGQIGKILGGLVSPAKYLINRYEVSIAEWQARTTFSTPLLLRPMNNAIL